MDGLGGIAAIAGLLYGEWQEGWVFEIERSNPMRSLLPAALPARRLTRFKPKAAKPNQPSQLALSYLHSQPDALNLPASTPPPSFFIKEKKS